MSYHFNCWSRSLPYPVATKKRYFARVRRSVLHGGERFGTVFDDSGAPAYYPTALALSRRSRGVSAETMAAEAADLIHIGLWAEREQIDLNERVSKLALTSIRSRWKHSPKPAAWKAKRYDGSRRGPFRSSVMGQALPRLTW